MASLLGFKNKRNSERNFNQTLNPKNWGRFTGSYKGIEGNGQTIHMYGFAVSTVNENSKITSIQIYFKPDDFLRALEAPAESDEVKKLSETFMNQKIN